MNDAEYLAGSIGAVARKIGQPGFHESLLELIGDMLPHETGWIVNYPASQQPDILYTKRVSPWIVDYYLKEQPADRDPYWNSWRTDNVPRIETMDAALMRSADHNFYTADFMKKMQFEDEVAIYLPAPGLSCISLFFERSMERFAEDDIRRLHRIFPMILDFHDTHLRALYANATSEAGGFQGYDDEAVAVFDAGGRLIISTERWAEAEYSFPDIAVLRDLSCCSDIKKAAADLPMAIDISELAEHSQFGPRSLVLNIRGFSEKVQDLAADAIIRQLTPRERDIVALILEGASTGHIAQRLGISKGTIKNCRLRIYRKFGVGSERALVAQMLNCASELKFLLSSDGTGNPPRSNGVRS